MISPHADLIRLAPLNRDAFRYVLITLTVMRRCEVHRIFVLLLT